MRIELASSARRASTLAACAAACLAALAPAAAQESRGSITGKVSDTSGAIVPGVAVEGANHPPQPPPGRPPPPRGGHHPPLPPPGPPPAPAPPSRVQKGRPQRLQVGPRG